MSLDINGDPNNPFWMLGQDEQTNSKKEVHIGGVDLNLDDVSDEELRSALVKVKGSNAKKVGDLSSGQLKEKIRRVWTTFAEFDLAMGVHELQGWQSDLESFERDLQKAGAKFEEIESKTDAVGKTVFGGKLRGKLDYVMRNKAVIRRLFGSDRLLGAHRAVSKEQIETFFSQNTGFDDWDQSRHNMRNRLRKVRDSRVKVMERQIEKMTAKELLWLIKEVDHPQTEFQDVVQKVRADHVYKRLSQIRDMEILDDDPSKEVLERDKQIVKDSLEMISRSSEQSGSFQKEIHKIHKDAPITSSEESIQQVVSSKTLSSRASRKRGVTRMDAVMRNKRFIEQSVGAPLLTTEKGGVTQEDIKNVMDDSTKSVGWKQSRENVEHRLTSVSEGSKTMERLIEQSSAKELILLLVELDRPRPEFEQVVASHQERFGEIAGLIGTALRQMENGPQGRDKEVAGQFQSVLMARSGGEVGGGLELRILLGRSDPTGSPTYCSDMHKLIEIYRGSPNKEDAQVLVKHYIQMDRNQADDAELLEVKEAVGQLVQPMAAKEEKALTLMREVFVDTLYGELPMMTSSEVSQAASLVEKHEGVFSPVMAANFAKRKELFEGTLRDQVPSGKAEQVMVDLLTESIFDGSKEEWAAIMSNEDVARTAAYRELAMGLRETVGVTEVLNQAVKLEPRCNDSQRIRLLKFAIEFVRTDFDRDLVGSEATKKLLDELINQVKQQPSKEEASKLVKQLEALVNKPVVENGPPPPGDVRPLPEEVPEDLTGALVLIASKDDGGAKVSHRDAALAFSQAVGADELIKHISKAEKRCNGSQRTRLAKFVTDWIEADPQVSKEYKKELITFLDIARRAYGNPSSDQVDVLQGLHRAITQSAQAESSLGIKSHHSLIAQIAEKGSTQSQVRETVSDLRMLSRDLFTGIKVDEFFGKGWEKKGDKNRSPNLVRAKDGFNGLGWVVVDDILRFDTVAERKRVWEFYADVAHQAMESGDFHTALAINSGGLGAAPVARLRQTTGAISEETERQQQSIRDLSSRNWKSYRATTQDRLQRGDPVYPFVGQEQSDRTFIIDGNEEEVNQYSLKKLRLLGKANLAFVEQQQLALQEPSQPMKTGIQAAVESAKSEKTAYWDARSQEFEPSDRKKKVRASVDSLTPEAKQDSKVGGKEDSSPDRVSRIQSIEGEYELPPMEEDPGPAPGIEIPDDLDLTDLPPENAP